MRLWLFRVSRWSPLLLAILVPALSWARSGGGQHYRSGREPSSRSSPSDGGGDLGGIIFYLVALTFHHTALMLPLMVGGCLFF